MLPHPFSLFELFEFEKKPKDYFSSAHLEQLFLSKIAKSQATGKDGVRIARFAENLAKESQLIERKVLSGSYSFTRFKERLLLRGAKRRPRQISIPTVRDRLLLRAVCQFLHENIPSTIGLSPHALVKRTVESIRSGDHSEKSFVRIDVKDFFPSISHRILKRELEHFVSEEFIRQVCLSAVATATGEDELNARGVPQGLSVSGALSALYMLRFDAKQVDQNSSYCRYVDDILLVCDTVSADDTLKKIVRSLKSRGLLAHPKGSSGKTEVRPVAAGVDFLGYHISVKKVSVRRSSFQKMFVSLSKVITEYRYRKNVERTLFRLNLKITGCVVDGKRRGWMMFFSHTEDMSQLSFLDKFIKRRLSAVGFPAEGISDVKRLIKSYHEIRFNLQSTEYIPNFDKFASSDKVKTIAALSGRSHVEVATWDAAIIDAQFSKLISREIHELEQDIGSPS